MIALAHAKGDMEMSDSSNILTEGYALSNFHQRAITALAIAFVSFGIILVGGWVMVIALIALSAAMNKEWYNIIPSMQPKWRLFGIAYITTPIIAALALRDLSLAALLYPIIMVIATDCGAFFAGRTIGGPKIYPSISPNKTWAGLAGGAAASALVAALFISYVPFPEQIWSAILIGIIIAVIAQAGDFFESHLKRQKGLKDSGQMLPGHGGLLDRLDGYIFVLPAYLLYLIIMAELTS